MLYVWQMNDGYWHISPVTNTAFSPSHYEDSINRGFETRGAAENALMLWRIRHPNGEKPRWKY